ncbi:MAG: dihydrodipicolinate synthase family protein [Prolixibacteraceae bacterium]
MNSKHFEGLVAATFTPFHSDGSVHPEIIPAYARQLKEDGVKGIFVCGSSGEGLLMEADERKAILEAWMPFSDEQFRIIAHVGSTSAKTSRDLARHAASVGADSVGCMGPCCFQPKDARGLTDYCTEVASAAPDLPFYYYHIPGTSGVHVKMTEFLTTAGKVIPNLAGIKYTWPDLMEMLECVSMEDGKYDILHGHDETVLAGFLFGVKAAIGTTYNFLAPVFNEMIEKFRQKDLDGALEIQKNVNRLIRIMLSSGSAISGGKAMMKMRGIDCGPCRLPLQNVTNEGYRKMEAELREGGYFSLIRV